MLNDRPGTRVAPVCEAWSAEGRGKVQRGALSVPLFQQRGALSATRLLHSMSGRG